MAAKRHRVGKNPRAALLKRHGLSADEYRSRASGQRAWVRTVSGDHVFITLEPSGSHGDMPLESFKRQYERDK
jgi:hypothetical protein